MPKSAQRPIADNRSVIGRSCRSQRVRGPSAPCSSVVVLGVSPRGDYRSSVHAPTSPITNKRCQARQDIFLFVGSERGGRAAAIYYSLIESCKLNKVNPLNYMTYLLSNVRNKHATLLLPTEFEGSSIAQIG
jgi:hypothetical protein